MQYYPTKFTVADLAQAATTEDLVESIVEEALDYYEKHSRVDAGRRGDDAPDRARRLPPDHGRPLARPPGRDGQPQGRHPPALDRPGRSPQRLAAGGLLHVRPADGGHRQRLPALHPPRRGGAARRRPSPTSTGPSTPRPRTRWPRPARWPRRCWPSRAPTSPPRRPCSAPRPRGNGSGGGGGGKAQIKRPNAPDPDALVPIVKEQHEKVGRNDPCWCGSGKKFKFCHGAA